MLIDTHAHLYLCEIPIEELLKNAQDSNLSKIVNVGTNIQNSLESFRLSQKYSMVIPTIGIHPSEHQDLDKVNDINKYLQKYTFAAIGEIKSLPSQK